VTEVGKGQVEEVDDQKKLAQPEVRPDPEVEEAEQQQVRCNVVGANVGRGSGVDGVCAPERAGVDELQDEEDDPGGESAMETGGRGERMCCVPIDGGDDAALGKGRGIVVLPEAAIGLASLVGLVEGVVEGGDDQEQVRQACRDLVQQKRLRGEGAATRGGGVGHGGN
jgi:hypothetical protein